MNRKLIITILLLGVALFPRPSHALSVSPPILDIAVKPGESIIDVVKVFNEEATPVSFIASMVNATDAGDELGTPVFYPANQDRDGQSLAKWFFFEPETITLKPGESFSQPFTINVPKDAQPGGHYGAMIFTMKTTDKSSGVSVGGKIAVLFLVTVEGDSVTAGKILQFETSPTRESFEVMPKKFIFRFENEGNIHVKPKGYVQITNLFGMTKEFIAVNHEEKSILPKTIRRIDIERQSNGLHNYGIGKYTAKLTLEFGDNKNSSEAEYVFYVWPKKMMIIGAISLAVLTLLAFLLRNKQSKRYPTPTI
jgi:hypothetical protein